MGLHMGVWSFGSNVLTWLLSQVFVVLGDESHFFDCWAYQARLEPRLWLAAILIIADVVFVPRLVAWGLRKLGID